jgi:hypothetical protein
LPTDLVIEGAVRFQLNPPEWNSDLTDVREAHTEFLVTDQEWSTEQATVFQKDLWHARASIALSTCGSFLTGLLVLIRIIGNGTAKFAPGILMRRKVYARRAVERMRWAAAANAPAVSRFETVCSLDSADFRSS